ncbi:MAG: hypothetical protein IKB86_02930 [Clostridia bacterium]|nr:hypothetical protein [Clostridia bacterium]
MENKITFSRSFGNMIKLIKESKGVFLHTIILVLIPVLIINCYSFFVLYDGFAVDYNSLTQLDVLNFDFSDKEAVNKLMEALQGIVPQSTQSTSLGDEVLAAINMLLTLFLDAFLVTLGFLIFSKRKYTLAEAAKAAVRKMFPILIVNLFVSWIFYELQNLIYVCAVLIIAAITMKEALFLYSVLATSAFYLLIALFVGGIVTLFYSYIILTVVSSRTRGILAFGYSREILKGKVFKQTLHIMPFVAVSVVLPMALQAVGIAGNNTKLGLILTAVSVIIQIVGNSLLWFYLLPDYFELEKTSGIQEKLRKMFEQAAKMQAERGRQADMKNNEQTTEEKSEDDVNISGKSNSVSGSNEENDSVNGSNVENDSVNGSNAENDSVNDANVENNADDVATDNSASGEEEATPEK